MRVAFFLLGEPGDSQQEILKSASTGEKEEFLFSTEQTVEI